MTRVKVVLDSIKRACDRSRRDVSTITLVAVSKGQSVSSMQHVADELKEHQVNFVFGENYVQEYREKVSTVGSGIRCDFIGRLQSNKVKEALPLFQMFHSIDSFRLAEIVNNYSREMGKQTRILLQVNVSADPKKGGIKSEDLSSIVEQIGTLDHIKLEGLMTITEHYNEPELIRCAYRKLANLRNELSSRYSGNDQLSKIQSLSMGMSGDYEIAIEEGTTHVRIGTALFGERVKGA